MNSAKPYLGCKIVLISKAQNKYEGILYTIDKVNSTVVLATVKCFGTEGRPTDRPTPPKDDVYEYITFRGSDIKDISLCEPLQSQYGLFPDPAIVQSSGATSETYSTLNLGPVNVPVYHQVPAHSQSLLNEDNAIALSFGIPIRKGPMVEKAVQTIGLEKSSRILPPSQEQWGRRRPQGETPVRQPARPPARPLTRRDPPRLRHPIMTTMKGGQGFPPAQQERTFRQNIENIPPRRRQGAWRGRNPQRQPVVANAHTGATLRFDTDFDFDSSNAKFIKEEFEYNMQNRANVKDVSDLMAKELSNSAFSNDPFGPKCFYNRTKSFYDNISSDQKLRISWAEERRRNLETFGVPGRFWRSQGFRGGYTRGRGRRTGQVVAAY